MTINRYHVFGLLYTILNVTVFKQKYFRVIIMCILSSSVQYANNSTTSGRQLQCRIDATNHVRAWTVRLCSLKCDHIDPNKLQRIVRNLDITLKCDCEITVFHTRNILFLCDTICVYAYVDVCVHVHVHVHVYVCINICMYVCMYV